MEPDELKIGRVYFSCGWSNPRYPVPVIRTYVYIGKNLYEDREDKSKDEYIFQSPIKYFEKEIIQGLPEEERTEYERPDEPTAIIVQEDSLAAINDIDGLIDFLARSKKERNAKEIF
jgi:hypothetical protein